MDAFSASFPTSEALCIGRSQRHMKETDIFEQARSQKDCMCYLAAMDDIDHVCESVFLCVCIIHLESHQFSPWRTLFLLHTTCSESGLRGLLSATELDARASECCGGDSCPTLGLGSELRCSAATAVAPFSIGIAGDVARGPSEVEPNPAHEPKAWSGCGDSRGASASSSSPPPPSTDSSFRPSSPPFADAGREACGRAFPPSLAGLAISCCGWAGCGDLGLVSSTDG